METVQQTIRVVDILNNLVEAWDVGSKYDYDNDEDFIKDIIKMKCKDPGFLVLCDMIQEQGMQTPISIDTRADGGLFLGNGHHRFVAAILLCLDEIPFTPYDYKSYGDENGEPFSTYSIVNGQDHGFIVDV